MKTIIRLFSLAAPLMLISVVPARAGGFSVPCSAYDAGCGSCAGGKFRLSCTVGQPNTATAAASAYVVQSGLLPAFEKVMAPPLTVTRSGHDFILSWANLYTGLHVEWTQNPLSDAWYDLGEGSVAGSLRQVRIPDIGGALFFRLRKDCPK